jgi:CubicO group peptidase (beta-lactamase class C family)
LIKSGFVDRGLLSLDDEVRQVLSHQAGKVALREPQPTEVLYDWDRMCELIAAEEPWWEPGTAHGERAGALDAAVRAVLA